MNIKAESTTRNKVLQAAVALFTGTHDVRKVSLEAIARQAGVSPTTIYNIFGSREKLVHELIQTALEDNLERTRQLVRSDLPFPQKLVIMANRKLDVASGLNSEIIEKISRDKTVARFIDGIYESEIRPLWLEIIADGKKQGFIDTSLDDQALLIYFDVLKAGFTARAEILRDTLNDLPLLEQLTRISFYGFLKKDVGLFGKGVIKGD